jgi:hypothetical protein
MQQRYVELLKTAGAGRREIAHYRGCHKLALELVEEVWDVIRVCMLEYYQHPELPLNIQEEIHQHAISLQKAIDKYERAVSGLEDAWVNSWK